MAAGSVVCVLLFYVRRPIPLPLSLFQAVKFLVLTFRAFWLGFCLLNHTSYLAFEASSWNYRQPGRPSISMSNPFRWFRKCSQPSTTSRQALEDSSDAVDLGPSNS